eukprot:COSAG06_NODE_20315_length_800_cov_0.924394_2_plen_96_part_00
MTGGVRCCATPALFFGAISNDCPKPVLANNQCSQQEIEKENQAVFAPAVEFLAGGCAQCAHLCGAGALAQRFLSRASDRQLLLLHALHTQHDLKA